MRLGPLIVMTLAVVAALVFFVTWMDFDFSNIRVQQGGIAAAVVVTGWLITFLFRELSVVLERQRKERDLQTALLAEIYDYSETLAVDDPAGWKKQVAIDVMAGEASDKGAYHPFFPKVSEPVIFETLSGDIHLLPRRVIDAVIQFYSLLSDVRLFIEDVRSEDFRSLPAERRITAYQDLLETRITAVEMAELACSDLRASLEGIPEWMISPDTGRRPE